MPRRGQTPWIAHVRQYQTEHGITFAQAMTDARPSYKHVPYGRVALRKAAAEQEEAGQEGSGLLGDLFAKAKQAITSRLEKRPLNVTNVLAKLGSQPIVKIVVCKQPINSVLRGILNLASGGDMERTIAQKGYDHVFHLFAQLTLANGTVMRIEKNQRVAIALTNADPGPNAKCEEAKLPKPTTLQEFIERGEKLGNSHGNFWRYSAYDDNCQKFIRDLLNGSGITAQDNFVMQDAQALVKSGFLRGLSRTATDIAAGADYIMKGGARDSNMKLFKAYKKAIISDMGRSSTTDSQLSAKGKELFGKKFRGVFSQDTLPVGRRGMYIVNVDTSGEPGSHWVGVVETGNDIYVYDSFARHMSDLMPILEAKLNRKHIHVHEKIGHATQWGRTEICGQLSLAFLCMVHERGLEAAMNF
jgi:hypothetical protein